VWYRGAKGMKAYVAITDGDWFDFLSRQEGIDEVNFWRPRGTREFRVLPPGGLFLFKLHSPENFIVGGGFFAHFSPARISLAWQAFGVKNGARSLEEMRTRVEKYREAGENRLADYEVGCIILAEPFFLPRDLWIPEPDNWPKHTVSGKTYDLAVQPGKGIWEKVQLALQTMVQPEEASEIPKPDVARYGDGILVHPRLGQGAFRIMVTDAYGSRCAVTQERVLPVLEAAHIQPYSAGGEQAVWNGLLLRSDFHKLFDAGYLTVTPELNLEVSSRIQVDFENGHEYREHHGSRIHAPDEPGQRPDRAMLAWHNENRFLG